MSKWHKIEMVGDSGDYLEECYCPGHGIEEIGLGYNVTLKCFESGFYSDNSCGSGNIYTGGCCNVFHIGNELHGYGDMEYAYGKMEKDIEMDSYIKLKEAIGDLEDNG